MASLRNPIVKLVAAVVLAAATITVLGAAAPVSGANGPHTKAVHHAGMIPNLKIIVANPQVVKPNSCSYESLGYWIESPGSNKIYIQPNVYNCSGNNYVDSVEWTFISGSGVQLQSWWFYSWCGNPFSADSGSPNTYLNSSNPLYSAYIGQNVSNPRSFDVDTQFNPGGEWTACM